MARLIDADALMKKYGLDNATKYGNKTAEEQAFSYDTMFMYEIADMIEDAPTIEAEPVIRCRDCAVPHNKWTGCPKLNGLVPPDDFYCAFGKKGDE